MDTSTLNMLPCGQPSPKFNCTAMSYKGVEVTVQLTEWWFEGKKVETIEYSAECYFYDLFDKNGFDVTNVELVL